MGLGSHEESIGRRPGTLDIMRSTQRYKSVAMCDCIGVTALECASVVSACISCMPTATYDGADDGTNPPISIRLQKIAPSAAAQ